MASVKQEAPLGGKNSPEGGGAVGLERIPVRIAAFPGGRLTDYSLDRGTTVEQAVKQARLGHLIGQTDIRLNGQPADLKREIRAGDQIILTAQIRGN